MIGSALRKLANGAFAFVAAAFVLALAGCNADCALANEIGHGPLESVRIEPGQNVIDVIERNPPGTTYIFAAGVHRLTESIVPKTGDRFIGELGAVLTGARVLNAFERSGTLWVAKGQKQQAPSHGSCRSASPRCGHPEDLFIDGVPLFHAPTLEGLTPGSWHFDYAEDRIYIADDPDGRLVETSLAPAAFVGDADGVSILNLVIEKFATRAQTGAIHAYGPGGAGSNWVIRNNQVRLNHGAGIIAGHGAIIAENLVHHNGQLGVGSNGGTGSLIEYNEIAYNNYAGFSDGWEAGGTKFVRTSGLVVRQNHVHHNDGPGLWTDIDNIHTLYEGNLVEHNTQTGIFHEISYDAVIRDNVVVGNGFGPGLEEYCYVHCAGILVYSSPRVSVYRNIVVGNWNGITGRYDDRGSGDHGSYALTDLHVYNNTIEMEYHPDGVGPSGEIGTFALTGVVAGSGVRAFDEDANNRFERNTYYLERDTHFAWRGRSMSFASWQNCGGDDGPWPGCQQDAGGTRHDFPAPDLDEVASRIN